MKFLVTFYTVSAAMQLEKVLCARGTVCKIIPVPRRLSSSCGYALEVETAEIDALCAEMQENNPEWQAVYSVNVADGEEEYEETFSVENIT